VRWLYFDELGGCAASARAAGVGGRHGEKGVFTCCLKKVLRWLARGR